MNNRLSAAALVRAQLFSFKMRRRKIFFNRNYYSNLKSFHDELNWYINLRRLLFARIKRALFEEMGQDRATRILVSFGFSSVLENRSNKIVLSTVFLTKCGRLAVKSDFGLKYLSDDVKIVTVRGISSTGISTPYCRKVLRLFLYHNCCHKLWHMPQYVMYRRRADEIFTHHKNRFSAVVLSRLPVVGAQSKLPALDTECS